MTVATTILFVLLALLALVFCAVWYRDLLKENRERFPTLLHLGIGLLTDFFDTLGIGSFAVTTTLYRINKTVSDELIPGTLNVGHCLPTICQAFIYIAIIKVETWTLVLTIMASVAGAWMGAGVVSRWNRQAIQRGMGTALLAAAGLILARLAHLIPEGGKVLGLEGGYLVVALVGNFIFGALMMIGVGAYAPIMIMVSLLGMNETTAFPIMMGSCAFLMPTAGMRIIRTGKYDPQAALGLTVGGIPGVLLAAFIVKNLPLYYLRWLVFVVVIWTAVSMLVASWRKPAPTFVDQL